MRTKPGFYSKYLKILILIIATTILMFPLIVALLTSLKPPGEVITVNPLLFPHDFTLQNYRDLFSIRDFSQYLQNSFLVASVTALISIMAASLAAYAIVWIRFPGKRAIVRSIFFSYMFPQILLIIPLFMMCYELNLVDKRMSLVLTYLSFSLPFSIWMLKSFFEAIPEEIVEAATLDGCNSFQCLMKIILPISLPAITAVVMYSFILGWCEYLFANTLILSDAGRTATIGLQTLIGHYRVDYGLITAAGMIITLPALIFFILIQKYFLKGLMISAVKE